MTQEELREIVDKHSKWLNGERGGGRADLSGANLCNISLRGANLAYADLRDANLSGADLICADLRGVDLSCANLCYANLHGAELVDADLRYAHLLGANLLNANFAGATYTGTVLNLQCPVEGSFIAWKKLAGDSIAKLFIPEDAKRSSATSRKCRASKAVVLAIYNKDGEEVSEGRSQHDHDFIYLVGQAVYPDGWNEDRWNECSNGIHFFVAREEAEEY